MQSMISYSQKNMALKKYWFVLLSKFSVNANTYVIIIKNNDRKCMVNFTNQNTVLWCVEKRL